MMVDASEDRVNPEILLKELITNFINNKRWDMYGSADEWQMFFSCLNDSVETICQRMNLLEYRIEKKQNDLQTKS